MEMQPFHDIESLRHVCEDVKRHCEYAGKEVRPTIKFRGTVKLHGTNGGVRLSNTSNDIIAQGRNRELTIASDSFGFAHFVSSRNPEFDALRRIMGLQSSDVTFYGEWCGTGIQKSVAIASLSKRFVIFAIQNHTTDEWEDIHAYEFNESIIGLLNEKNIYLITQAPVFEVEINFNDPVAAAELISQYTIQVEECCPFSAVFGVEGLGEGIVWISYDYPVRLYFKSKGEKHKNAGPKTHVAIDPQKVADISALVDVLLPEWRLEQGFSYLLENNIEVSNVSTGAYLKWVAQDVLKEESDIIAANPFSWKEIQGGIMTRAKAYFFRELDSRAGMPNASELTL